MAISNPGTQVSALVPIGQLAGMFTNITPLTYRDGLTYLTQVEAIGTWIRDELVPFLSTNGLTGDFDKALTDIANQMDDALNKNYAHTQAVVDSFQKKLDDIAASQAGVIAPAISSILADTANAVRTELMTAVAVDFAPRVDAWIEAVANDDTKQGAIAIRDLMGRHADEMISDLVKNANSKTQAETKAVALATGKDALTNNTEWQTGVSAAVKAILGANASDTLVNAILKVVAASLPETVDATHPDTVVRGAVWLIINAFLNKSGTQAGGTLDTAIGNLVNAATGQTNAAINRYLGYQAGDPSSALDRAVAKLLADSRMDTYAGVRAIDVPGNRNTFVYGKSPQVALPGNTDLRWYSIDTLAVALSASNKLASFNDGDKSIVLKAAGSYKIFMRVTTTSKSVVLAVQCLLNSEDPAASGAAFLFASNGDDDRVEATGVVISVPANTKIAPFVYANGGKVLKAGTGGLTIHIEKVS